MCVCRKHGYYWIKVEDHWRIAEYRAWDHGNSWIGFSIPGISGLTQEEDLEEINEEQIPNPYKEDS